MDESKKGKQKYQKLVDEVTPNSPIFTNCIKAFVSGGIICTIGEAINNCALHFGQTSDNASLITSIVLILASVTLTGFGLYSKLGKFCGAGTIVPITGFANSVASPAIEFKKEGIVMGLGSKMFAIAGPVIVYGTVTSVIVGLFTLFFS